MKKAMKSRVSFTLSVLMGLALLFTSCSRNQGVISYNNEKLRKQSAEIENSTYSASTAEADANLSASVNETTINETSVSYAASKEETAKKIEAKLAEKKLSLAEKIVLKKLNKKLNPSQKFEAKKKSGLDEKLKYAIIFGGVGIILMILGVLAGFFYVLGVISIVVALVFLLLWLIENA